RWLRMTSFQRNGVGTRVDVDAPGLIAGKIGCDAQPFEVRRIEDSLTVERRELLVLRLPIPTSGRPSRAIVGVRVHAAISLSVRDDAYVGAWAATCCPVLTPTAEFCTAELTHRAAPL